MSLWLDGFLGAQNLRKPLPPHEEIARTAYLVWQQEGCPHGHDKEHWHRAIAQLRRLETARPPES
jgi:hypothetical protein